MPIYEYKCPDCQLKFEMFRPLNQSSEAAACPRCQKSAERVMSTFACFGKDESGVTSAVGGDSCGSCASGSCSSCGH